MDKPCLAKDVLQFNHENLIRFLEFLETKSKESNTQIIELKNRLGVVEITCNTLSQQLPMFVSDFDRKIKSINERADTFDIKLNSVGKAVQKLQEFETKSKDKIEKIPSMQDDITLLLKNTEESKRKIEKLQSQYLQLSNDFVNKTNDFENSINTLFRRSDKIFDIEREILEIKEKYSKKLKKLKEKDRRNENRMIEIESSINTICDCFPTIKNARITSTSSKKEDFSKLSSIDLGSNLKKEFDDFVEESKRFRENSEKEIRDLKNHINSIKNTEFEDRKSSKEKDDKTPIFNEIYGINAAIKELQSNEKFFINAISGKAGKEEMEKNHKSIHQELEKLNQRITKNNKEILTVVEKIEVKNSAEVKKEDNIVTMMGGVEEIKRVMIETIKDSESIQKIKDKQSNLYDDLIKLNENLLEMQKVLKEEISNPKLIDLKDLLGRINQLESNEKYFKSMIDEIRSDEQNIPDSPIKSPLMTSVIPNTYKSPVQRRNSTIKDFVLEATMNFSQITDRLDRLNSRMDAMNKDILEKVKRDLIHESNKILDEFRLDLKFSISKIEEQMREKVDKFNMEEFTRKFEKKMLLEINTKIDRVDLKKNNTILNKKIEGIENKISKTLVDTLIDLQMEDAPLIIKKSAAGSDKCASCNQNLPTNFMNHTHCITEFSNPMNMKKNGKNKMAQSVDKTTNTEMKNVNSSGFFNNLPEINNVEKRFNRTNVNSPKNKNGKRKIQSTFNESFRKFDEYAERQLNSVIKDELDKNFVNPEKLIKASKKVYDTIIDKKK